MMTLPKSTTFLTVVSFVLFAGFSTAKEKAKVNLKEIKHPVKPMLWKIEGKGLKKPSYLFGTVHISDPRASTLHPLAKQAFDQADTLYTEVSHSPAAQRIDTLHYTRADDKTLEDVAGKELVDALRAELEAISPTLNTLPFEKMKLWVIAFSLHGLEDQIKGLQSLDDQLWHRAKKAGKKLGALETSESRCVEIDKLTMDEQKEILGQTLKMLKRDRKAKVDTHQETINLYLLGDMKGLEEVMAKATDSEFNLKVETEEKLNRILAERNKTMAASIKKALANPEAGSCFFAAGTAHYLGEHCVNRLLKKAGYTVTPVAK